MKIHKMMKIFQSNGGRFERKKEVVAVNSVSTSFFVISVIGNIQNLIIHDKISIKDLYNLRV